MGKQPGHKNDAPAGRVERLKVEVQGAVQGVGFRPFVYRLASELSLRGWVLNDTRGVFIEVDGSRPVLENFLSRLRDEAPPRAVVHSIAPVWLEPAGYDGFEIRHSLEAGARTASVLPDMATCPDCLAEVDDPGDRRYRYPFTNCTNCGPRFTILRTLPYDRPNTTMQGFVMCPACRAEYDDPANRRFHAQPNACPVCGPQIALWNAAGATLSQGDDALALAARALGEGKTVAVKGLGGFHLMVDARSEEAVARLRARKPRREKPFALMVRDLDQARSLCVVDEDAARILSTPEAPILLLPRPRRASPVAAQDAGRPSNHGSSREVEAGGSMIRGVADGVAPGNPNLGIMLPATPLHHLLLKETGFPVVATSGNLSDEPICTDETEALGRLGGIADLFLVHDRPIARHVDDSVGWIVNGGMRLLRRARGYAPLPVLVRDPLPTILAVGAHLKNTVALSAGSRVFLSQHIGDLETPEAMTAFESVIADFLELYDASPVAIAHDLHPDYLSTRWAQRIAGRDSQGASIRPGGAPDATDPLLGRRCAPDSADPRSVRTGAPDLADPLSGGNSATDEPPGAAGLAARIAALAGVRLVPVQHHHAHLASCLAENGVDGPALGVTWDGTGYGTDGTVWGGEFLLGSAREVVRVAHLLPFRLIGGEAAVREPRRTALALLLELMGEACLDRDDIPTIRAFTPVERALLARMWAQGVNSPVTTSAGRLFDAVASLTGLRQTAAFEGQAAMELEFAAADDESSAYAIRVQPSAQVGKEVLPPPPTPPGAESTIDPRDARSDRAIVEKPSIRPGSPGTTATAGTQPSLGPRASGTTPTAGAQPSLGPRASGTTPTAGARLALVLDWRDLVAAILEDRAHGVSAQVISARFHNALAGAIVAVAREVGAGTVALTGGCFQNRRLTMRAARRLEEAGFRVLLHRQVPPNDGGISLGQIAVAAATLAAVR